MAVAAAITLESLHLASGSHKTPKDGLCVMEAVAYFRGIPHTDHPQCVSEVIGTFLRSWNDALDDESRQMLKPYILKVVGTAGTAEDEERRGWLAMDWLVRTCAPAWLDLANLTTHAAKLRALPELTTSKIVRAAQADIAAAGDAAWAAAGAVAGAAAWDAARASAWDAAWAAAGAAAGAAARAAAWAAAGDAAWDAAGDAARAVAWAAAGDAAGDAAWAVAGASARASAWDAVWAAAGAAAGAALQPTVVTLQASALDLLDRMIAVKRAEPA